MLSSHRMKQPGRMCRHGQVCEQIQREPGQVSAVNRPRSSQRVFSAIARLFKSMQAMT